MSKKKLTPEQMEKINSDTADLDVNLNDAVGLDPDTADTDKRIFFTS